MIYLYTREMCSNCIKLKKEYDEKGIKYIERDGNRLIAPVGDRDTIDIDALMELALNNMEFPVEVVV